MDRQVAAGTGGSVSSEADCHHELCDTVPSGLTPTRPSPPHPHSVDEVPTPDAVVSAYFEIGGRQDTPAFLLGRLAPGQRVPGPAILIDDISTIVVEPGCAAFLTAAGDVRISIGDEAVGAGGKQGLSLEADPIQLAVFSHRWVLERGMGEIVGFPAGSGRIVL